jgi:hypothetical protein
MRDASVMKFEHLDGLLDRMPKRAAPEPVWILSRYTSVMDRAEQMIRSAQRSVCLSAWPREIERLRDALVASSAAPHRLLHCPTRLTDPPEHFSCWLEDPLEGDAKADWSHRMLLVVDRQQVLVGGAEPEADNHAVWTMNPSIIDVVTNHVILDVTLIARRTGRPCEEDVAPLMRPHGDS